jgi:hypothetical protein
VPMYISTSTHICPIVIYHLLPQLSRHSAWFVERGIEAPESDLRDADIPPNCSNAKKKTPTVAISIHQLQEAII